MSDSAADTASVRLLHARLTRLVRNAEALALRPVARIVQLARWRDAAHRVGRRHEAIVHENHRQARHRMRRRGIPDVAVATARADRRPLRVTC